jgi:molecular chaperone GrpE (heat shock protein)
MTTDRDDTPTTDSAPETGALPDDVASLQALIEEEREKSQRHFTNWQRAAADHQNFKRRVEEERSENARIANITLIINLLPIVDDFDRAFMNIDPTVAGLNWVEGVRQVQKKLHNLLEMMGVAEINADGEPFDPSVHEAVSQAPGEENRVVAVAQKGYKLGDRVIRPAMVVVGKAIDPGP